MKKTLATVFSILAVLLIIIFIWNFVFGNNIIGSVLNGFVGKINAMWQSITKTDLIQTTAETSSVGTIANGNSW